MTLMLIQGLHNSCSRYNFLLLLFTNDLRNQNTKKSSSKKITKIKKKIIS